MLFHKVMYHYKFVEHFKVIELSCPHTILDEETLTTLSDLATSWKVR